MVETISPVVHGGRTKSYWSALALHVLGATLAAALLGDALGTLGIVLGAPWGGAGLYALAIVALLYVWRELLRLPVPSLRKQVPAWWRTFY